MTIQSLGYKNGDRVSISINGKEHSPNKPGINVVVMDFMTFQVTEAVSFDTGHDKEASERLIECIDMIPVGTLVFIAVRGEATYYMTGEFCSLRTISRGYYITFLALSHSSWVEHILGINNLFPTGPVFCAMLCLVSC